MIGYRPADHPDAETAAMETDGGAVVRSCRYTWQRPALLAGT